MLPACVSCSVPTLGPTEPAAAGASPGAPQSPVVDIPALADCGKPTAPRAPLRRLTRFEYNNSVRDLRLDDSAPADALPGEELGNGFGNDADALGVSPLLIDGYRQVAQRIAERVTTDAAALAALGGCDPTSRVRSAARRN